MSIGFFLMGRKMNKVQNKIGKAVDRAMAAVNDLSKANNELDIISAEAELKANHYSDVNSAALNKKRENEAMIEQLKKIHNK